MASAFQDDLIYADEPEEVVIDPRQQSLALLAEIASHNGDLSPFLDEQALTTLGHDVVRDYELDCRARSDWETVVKKALESAAQETKEAKNYPFEKASNVRYPILTIAATEFNARAYPAIVKGDETIQVKVVGSDKGRPKMMQTPQGLMPEPQTQPDPQTGEPVPVIGPDGQPMPVWEVPPGAKASRAQRVKDYLNVVLNYRMTDWEADTDSLLYQLAIVGCGFRKCWWDTRKSKPCSAYVPALRLIAPMDAKSVETTPRLTEEIPDEFPYQIRQKMASGEYRTVELTPLTEDNEAARMLLEQHRLYDLDGDGFDEPYIVTVDKETSEVLRVVAAFGPDDVRISQDGLVEEIEKSTFYIKYDFLPHPSGKFYGIGLGHLLAELSEVINTTINQMIDAGHAQIAGGGFIAAGLRLQGSGQNNTLRWRPGEYKVVTAQGGTLQQSIYERTFPNPSPIMFSLLDLILGAAKDVAAIKDVTSGDASNQGQVGTTLALIEQGLQVFTAIYKRVYRALRGEFQLLYTNIGTYGTEVNAKDYVGVLDDPRANFQADFNLSDMDIRPVSDPGSVTRLQKMAKAQFLMQTGQNNPNVDQRELILRVYEAADVEDIEKLVPPTNPNAPPPPEVLKIDSETKRNLAQAALYEAQIPAKRAEAEKITAEAGKSAAQTAQIGVETGLKIGEAEADDDSNNEGRVSAVAGAPDY